jgi:hypothetical protein
VIRDRGRSAGLSKFFSNLLSCRVFKARIHRSIGIALHQLTYPQGMVLMAQGIACPNPLHQHGLPVDMSTVLMLS